VTPRHALALDQGGSFLDIIAAPEGGGAARIAKRPRAEAANLAAAIIDFCEVEGIAPASITIATTLPANAILTGTASPVVLVTTQGFEDLPDLGRQSRRDPDALDPPPPTPAWLSPPHFRFGLPGRIDARGVEVAPLDLTALPALPGLPVAACLLFAHRNPVHEQAIAAALPPGTALSLSHRVDPETREFERMLATMLDASLKPLVATTLAPVARALVAAGLPAPHFALADGSTATPGATIAAPLPLLLSGPAAGARAVARWAAGVPCAIGLDMGGTTAEVSLVRDGVALETGSVTLGPLAFRLKALDVESLAIGGDALTDAARAAGWLPGEADAGKDSLAIAEARLAEATRRIALRRNIHPDLSLLVAGGGFGPLLGAAIAGTIGCPRVLVPPCPGVMAASGLLDSAPALPATWRHRDGTPFAGNALGPLLLDDGTATARIPAGWRASLRSDGALLLDRAA
jgi:N-methylhydantoinase A